MNNGIIQPSQAGGVTLVAKKSVTAPTKSKETPDKDEPKESILEEVVEDFKSAWKYTQSSWHDRWENNYKLYNNNRVKRGYQGITDTFVPMVYSTVETKTAALFGMKPKFAYTPPSDKPDQKTDILNSVVDYYWEKDQWSLKVINTGRSMYNLGTGIDYFFWNITHPKMLNIPVRDFFICPCCTDIATAHYVGRRFLSTTEDLKSFEIVDAETGEAVKRYKNLDNVNEGSDTQEKTDKQEKDMLYGSTLSEPEDKQVEVIEYWTLEKTVTVVNRSVVAEDVENWYLARAKALGFDNPKGFYPFADARYMVDPSLFYAKGVTDFISDQQELLNDITNQNIDSVTFTLNQMYTLDPEYADKITEVENLPGAVYPFKAGALVPIQQRPIPADAFNERMNIKNEIRETTASNEVVKGVGQQNSNTTATEIQAQIAGAGQRINLDVTQIENGYFYQVAKIIFNMIRLYVTEPTMIRILGKDGARWEEFDPSEFADGEYEPRVQLDIAVQNDKQKRGAEAKELLAAFLNDPDVNQLELKKLVLQRSFDLDPDEVEALTAKPDQMGADMGMGLPPEAVDPMSQNMPPEMMGGLPPEMPPMPEQMPQEAPVEPQGAQPTLNGVM